MGRALAVLPAVETAAIVINAESGIELVAQRMMAFAAERKLCRLIVVNKIDAAGADLAGIFREIRETFGRECLPLNLPARGGEAVADCFFEPASETPDFSSVAAAHTEILDQVVELDDDLMELYLEQGENISLKQLHDPFERALRAGHLIPVCFVSAKTGAGLRQLLRIFTELCRTRSRAIRPSSWRGRRRAQGPGQRPLHRPRVQAHVDPYVGRIATFRVHEGEVKTGDQVFIGEKRRP